MVNEQDPSLQQIAQDLIRLFHRQQGQSQASWEEAVRAYEGANVDYIFIRGLAKVLTDAATFKPMTTPLPPATLREQVFAYGPVFEKPDLFHTATRLEVLHEVAETLELSPGDLDEILFADRGASYRLIDPGPAWTPSMLLARYNLELARGALYWASHITIEVSNNYKDLWKFGTQTEPLREERAVTQTAYKDLWRYIKLFKLMFWAEPLPQGGYRIDLDGPISPFVSATTRYGRQMAAFLPALLLCEYWRMHAYVRPPQAQGETLYRLDHTCSLKTHFKSSGMFDSQLEEDFAYEFEQKMGDKRGHWQLLRESEVLLLGDTVMIPDFALIDEADETRKILIELVGFWHPNYLRRKVEKVHAANCAHLLLLVYQGLNVTEEAFEGSASEVVFFQNKPVLKEVMEKVEAMALRIYGPRPKRKRKMKTKSPE
jgi:predicted nuclease of restriction endonuclease-like RecB superfamily